MEKGKVSLYICGVTVYDHCHIGHARAYVAFDTIKRVLTHFGYNVNHVQNFTDIDDKIINRANETNTPWKTLTETFIGSYFEDMDALGGIRANQYPLATAFIPQMIALIQDLIDKNIAYVGSDSNVYFSIDNCPNYGKLSHRNLDDQESGARVNVVSAKKNPMDFVLWKPAKPDEPAWDSPWGSGRPGWHTECAVMVHDVMGHTIDIHGGGEDLKFPHHENEIAQAECCSNNALANIWMHNGFVQIDSEKMSKSTGNFFTIKDVLQEVEGETLRFFLQKVHYRSPIHFSKEGIQEAGQALERLYNTLRNVPMNQQIPKNQIPEFNALEEAFLTALADDFNISGALGHLFDMSRLINTHQAGSERLFNLGQILGLFTKPIQSTVSIPKNVTQMAQDRQSARAAKDFAKSDELRDQILASGFQIKDTPDGFKLTPS